MLMVSSLMFLLRQYKRFMMYLLSLSKKSMIRMMLLQLQLNSHDLPLKILMKNIARFQDKKMMKLSLNPVRLMKNLVGSVREAEGRRLGLHAVMQQLGISLG